MIYHSQRSFTKKPNRSIMMPNRSMHVIRTVIKMSFCKAIVSNRQRLMNEMNLAYNVYNQLAQQLQMSKAKVQEITPVYTVVQPATVPLKPAKPNKIMILIGLYLFSRCG